MVSLHAPYSVYLKRMRVFDTDHTMLDTDWTMVETEAWLVDISKMDKKLIDTDQPLVIRAWLIQTRF
jgi:hypothetical protein